MIIDHWNPSQKRYQTFCYGPKSCSLYRAGATRKVPGRKGMSYTQEDWIDEDATSHREPDPTLPLPLIGRETVVLLPLQGGG